MTTTTLQAGHVIGGRYRIEELLGEGGMGSVYRATQLVVDRSVAIKLSGDPQRCDPRQVERFEREARALARLTHPNTVRLFDFGSTDDKRPFIVMEFLSGQDLAALLAERKRLTIPEALHVAVQVLRSLHEAHTQGVVHRDIKPANIFLCTTDTPTPLVKVLDFGIAGISRAGEKVSRLTAAGMFIGSAVYMSPEQAEGQLGGPAADLYSVGVVLFEMVTGRTVFEATTLSALLLTKLRDRAPRVREVSDVQVQPALQQVLDELLARNPKERPSSARAAADRLEVLLGNGSLGAPSSELGATGEAGAAAPGRVAPTQPMPVRGVTEPSWREPHAASARRRYVVTAALAASVLAAGVVLGRWVLRGPSDPPAPEDPRAAQTEREVTAVESNLPSLARGPRPDGVDPRAEEGDPAAPTSERTPSTRSSGSSTSALHPPDDGSAEPPTEPPRGTTEPPSAPPALDTVAAVIAARNVGTISQLESNRRIKAIRQQRYAARVRAGRQYKAGKISLAELREQQRAIDERYEGN
jgi:serine/threonine-protein kinase